ncbi:MAG TPA: Smr/MutS family protein [Edaphobacter sp.]
MRKVDIAHSGQTVSEAMDQLEAEVKNARRARETVLLLVHGFGASGVGGAIKAALATELPQLARNYGVKAYAYADKDRIPRQVEVDPRRLNPGSTVLIFRQAQPDKGSQHDVPSQQKMR